MPLVHPRDSAPTLDAPTGPTLARPSADERATPRRPTSRPPPRDDRPRWQRITRKVLIGLAIAIVGLYVLYVVAANIAIKTRLVRNAINSFPKRSVEYSSAWTLWPGVVHVKDLRIRVQDTSEEFLFVLDDTVADIDLPALLKYRLHARWVKTHGLSFRFRTRIDPRTDPHPVTYALPPIEGFADVPFKDVDHYDPPPLAAELTKVFTFDLANVEADGVHEIWVDDYRVVGDGLTRGSLHLSPSRSLAVGASHFELLRGSMFVGKDVVVDDMKGQVDATLDWFQPRSAYGIEILEHLTSVDATLDAHAPDLAFIEHRYLAGKSVRLVGGAGPVHLDMHVRHGDLESGTVITHDAKGLELHFGNRSARLTTALRFEVEDREGAPEAQLHLAMTNVGLFVSGSLAEKTPTITATQAAIFARSKNLGLVKPFNDLLYSFDVPALTLADVRVLQRFLPPGTPLRLGKGSLVAHVHLDATRASGGGQATIAAKSDNVFLRYHDASLDGKVAIDLKLGNLMLATMSANASHSTIDLTDFVLTEGTKQQPPWWGHLELDGAAFHPMKKDVLATDVVLKLRDVRPILRTYAAGPGLPEWVAKLLPMENFQGRARLRFNDGIDVDDFRARSDDASVGMRYHAHHGHVKGQILVEDKGLDVGLDISDSGSKPVLLGAYDWYTGGK